MQVGGVPSQKQNHTRQIQDLVIIVEPCSTDDSLWRVVSEGMSFLYGADSVAVGESSVRRTYQSNIGVEAWHGSRVEQVGIERYLYCNSNYIGETRCEEISRLVDFGTQTWQGDRDSL